MQQLTAPIKPVSRAKGHSATAAAAYQAGETIVDARTGEIHRYENKPGVENTFILTPSGLAVPEWTQDRQKVWNEDEAAQRQYNATVARKIVFATPCEFNKEQREALAREQGQYLADRYQVVVDVALHEPDKHSDERNYHTHFLISTHQITAEGFRESKSHKDPETGKTERFIALDYGGKRGSDEVKQFRSDIAEITNNMLERCNIDKHVEHRSYEEQGLDKLPTVHLGKHAIQLEEQGIETGLGDYNRKAKEWNQFQDIVSHTGEQPVQAANDNDFSAYASLIREQETTHHLYENLTAPDHEQEEQKQSMWARLQLAFSNKRESVKEWANEKIALFHHHWNNWFHSDEIENSDLSENQPYEIQQSHTARIKQEREQEDLDQGYQL